MQNSNLITLFLLGIAAFLGLAALSAAQAQDDVRLDAYLPVEPGTTWTYEVIKKRVYVLPNGQENVQNFEGTTVERIVGPSGDVKHVGPDGEPVSVVILAQQMREKDVATGQARDAETATYLSVEPHQILAHAQSVQSAEFSSEGDLTRFDEPVALVKVPLPKADEPFPSKLTFQDMTIDMRPIAMHRETIETPAGEFENCLRIDSKGPIIGSLPGPQGPLQIQSGSYEGSAWYAEGVGIVRETQTLALEIEVAPGQKIKSIEEKTKTLQ